MLAYIGVISTLYFVFRIRKLLKGGDYFRQDIIRYIYKLCGIAFGAALCNSAANACMETFKEFGKKHFVGLAEVKGRLTLHLFEQVFDVNLLVYVLIISLFLLTTFFLKAIEIKTENESFI